MNYNQIFNHFSISNFIANGDLSVYSPIDGTEIVKLKKDDSQSYDLKNFVFNPTI